MKDNFGILDPRFKYVNAASTDIRKTIAREKKRLEEAQKKEAQVVTPMRRKV